MLPNSKRIVLKRSQLEEYTRKSLIGHWVWVTESCEDLQKENDKSSKQDRKSGDASGVSTRFTAGNVTVRPGSAEGFLDISGGGYLHAEDERFDGGGPLDRVSTVNADDNLLRLESFHTFKSVRRLSLRRNCLKSVRPIGGDLAKTLIHLDVSENQLNPDDIYRLSIMPNLEQLYMLANNLKVIPERISNCHCFLSLKLLDLSDNYLSCPRTFYMLSTLHNLQVLSMSNNLISFIPYLTTKQEADNSTGDNQSEAYQDKKDTENDKHDAKEIVYQVHHIPFVNLNKIDLSNNLIAHSSSVLPLVCWPSLKNVVLTANTISLKKNLIEFKYLSSTLNVFNIKTKR